VLLIVVVVSYALVQILHLLARIEVAWWMVRSTQLDDFRIWAQEVCTDPWNTESLLCQAVEGNWLARELVRAKLHQADADHCDPDGPLEGCRHDPCLSNGLSAVLVGVADSWRSPLNNRLDKMFYILLPIRQRLRVLLHGMAKGELPLSAIEKELKKLTYAGVKALDRHIPFLGDKKRDKNTREWLLNEHVYPAIRNWGVIIGGASTRPARPQECPETLESFLHKATHEPSSLRDDLQRGLMDVQAGFGAMVGGMQAAAHFAFVETGLQALLEKALLDDLGPDLLLDPAYREPEPPEPPTTKGKSSNKRKKPKPKRGRRRPPPPPPPPPPLPPVQRERWWWWK